jgi:5,5'-dehydrodivanillate O-demethylase
LLSEARNRLLCETGQGTPMGELLRRYWHPVAGAAEFSRQSVKAVRVLGEDLAGLAHLRRGRGKADRRWLRPPPGTRAPRARPPRRWPTA